MAAKTVRLNQGRGIMRNCCENDPRNTRKTRKKNLCNLWTSFFHWCLCALVAIVLRIHDKKGE